MSLSPFKLAGWEVGMSLKQGKIAMYEQTLFWCDGNMEMTGRKLQCSRKTVFKTLGQQRIEEIREQIRRKRSE